MKSGICLSNLNMIEYSMLNMIECTMLICTKFNSCLGNSQVVHIHLQINDHEISNISFIKF